MEELFIDSDPFLLFLYALILAGVVVICVLCAKLYKLKICGKNKNGAGHSFFEDSADLLDEEGIQDGSSITHLLRKHPPTK